MKRRAFLATALLAGAGCIGSPGGSGTGTTVRGSTTETTSGGVETQTTTQPRGTPTTAPPTTTPAMGGTRTVEVTNVSQGDLGKLGLTATVSCATDTVTAAHPAAIRLTVTATAPVTVTHLACPPGDLRYARPESGDAELVLTEHDPTTDSAACWRIDRRLLNLGQPCRRETITVTPRSPCTRAFVVWDSPDNPECFPPGTYGTGYGFEKDDSKYGFSFDLRVSE